jgi:hypothetical protein
MTCMFVEIWPAVSHAHKEAEANFTLDDSNTRYPNQSSNEYFKKIIEFETEKLKKF